MTNGDLLIYTILSLISGSGFLILHQIYLNRKEKRKELENTVIKPKQITRQIDYHTIASLTPPAPIELMKELLGAPFRYVNSDNQLFTEKEVKTHSYIYLFNNASIKITSKNNKIIDSLTVFGYDDKIHHEMLEFFSDDGESHKLGEMTVNKNLIDNCTNHTLIQTRMHRDFAISVDVPYPHYKTFTYFGYPKVESFSYHESKNPELFLGGTIDGFCISSNPNDVYFIYDYELR